MVTTKRHPLIMLCLVGRRMIEDEIVFLTFLLLQWRAGGPIEFDKDNKMTGQKA